MSSVSFRAWWALLTVATLAAAAPPADPPKKTQAEAKSPPTAGAREPVGRRLENLNVPPDAILILCEKLKQGLELIPDGILLTPQRFQELRRLEEEKNRKRQAESSKPATPTACMLSGNVDGEMAYLQAQFKITTNRPSALVALGCQRAWLRSASLDGNLPLFHPDPAREDGFVVEIPSPGTHVLTLALETAVTFRGAKGRERGIDIGLPRSAITRVERLRFPAGVSEVRVNPGRTVAVRTAEGPSGQIEDVLLGPADRLDLSWQGAEQSPDRTPPLLAADGRLAVRVEDKRVVTDVEFVLQALRGETQEWRVFVPPESVVEMKEPAPADDRVERVELPGSRGPWLTVRLKKPSAATLRLVLQVTQNRAGTRVAVGPFLVAGASRQRGTIDVVAPPEYRFTFHPDRGTFRREPPDDSARNDLVALFTYSTPLPSGVPPQLPQPLLAFDVEPVKGAVEVKVDHLLQLTDEGWRVSSRFDVNPVRTAVDALEMQIPPDYRFDPSVGASPAELIDDQPVVDVRRQVLVVRLTRRQSRPFSVTLPALYPVPAAGASFAPELPRLLQARDRGGQVSVMLPEGQELVARSDAGDPLPPGTRKYTWSSERSPQRAEVVWRPYQPELRADSVVDVTLRERGAWAVQRMTLQFPQAAIAGVRLRIPGALKEGLRLLEGGTLGADGWVTFNRAAKRSTLAFAYSLPVPSAVADGAVIASAGVGASVRSLSVPYVRVARATKTDTKVRVWAETATRVEPADATWDELPCEAVPDKASLPVLVLRSGRGDRPLAFRLSEPRGNLDAAVMVERALFQSEMTDDGTQHCRARFVLTRVGTTVIEVQFPWAVAGLRPEARLDGKRLSTVGVDDDAGRESAAGSVLRLGVEPELYQKPVMLDLTFSLSPGHVSGSGAFRSVLSAPVIRGAPFPERARWKIAVPTAWITLSVDTNVRPDYSWQWRGGLLTPAPAASQAELEDWLGSTPGTEVGARRDDGHTGLTCWRTDPAPFQIIHLPREGWLLGCSLLFLGLGLALCFAPLSPATTWAVAACLGFTWLIGTAFWPGLMPAIIYGCEPGALILGLVVGVHTVHQYYHRRRQRFLPGFVRTRPATDPANGSGSRRHLEPSTVDAPASRGSSVNKRRAQEV